IPIILSSDKTIVSVATGNNEYYPLYLSVGNMHNTVLLELILICHSHHTYAVVLIVFLAM
ncbi:hypothetical protein PAXRUDRAFT_37997, partial [Paxillus rubicundulus Ve08.2h10]